MELYLKVSFCMQALSVGIYLVELCSREYPYKKTVSVGSQAFVMVVTMLFAFWSGYLVFLK